MPRELNVISQPGSSSGGDACTYMQACDICDENETCQKDKEGHSRWLVAKRMERIEYKVLVMSNKGGVGKSTCTTNLAVSLALKGWHVGICDMDINGPNIPKMVGAEGQKLKISTSGGIIPFQAYNMKIGGRWAWHSTCESAKVSTTNVALLARLAIVIEIFHDPRCPRGSIAENPD